MNEELRITKIYILISFTTFILFTSILCFFLSHFYISRPLHKLGLAMRAFKNSQEPTLPVPVTGQRTLNRMSGGAAEVTGAIPLPKADRRLTRFL